MLTGDIIECNGEKRAIIIDLEHLYPGHPESPVRFYKVVWLDGPPKYSWKTGNFFSVSPFSVRKVISRASR